MKSGKRRLLSVRNQRDHAAAGDLRQADAGVVIAELLGLIRDDPALGPVCLVFEIGGSDGADVAEFRGEEAVGDMVLAPALEGGLGGGVERGAVEVLVHRDGRVFG